MRALSFVFIIETVAIAMTASLGDAAWNAATASVTNTQAVMGLGASFFRYVEMLMRFGGKLAVMHFLRCLNFNPNAKFVVFLEY